MYRTAVDKGANPRDLLGVNSSYLKEFHEIKNDVELSHWLTRWLEDFISTSLDQVAPSPPDSIALAIEYMKNNLDQPHYPGRGGPGLQHVLRLFLQGVSPAHRPHLHRSAESLPHRKGLRILMDETGTEHQSDRSGLRIQ